MKGILRQIILALCLAGIIFASLGWEMGHPQALPKSAGYVLSKDNENAVYLEAKKLTSEETTDYVHKGLISSGYQPVLLQIDNTGPFTYRLEKHQVDIPTENADAVSHEIGKSAIPRTVAFKILGFLFWPLAIPGTIDSVNTMNQQYILKRDLAAKTLKEEGELIPPYSSMSRILYVPQSELKEVVHINMTNIDKKRIENFYLLIT